MKIQAKFFLFIVVLLGVIGGFSLKSMAQDESSAFRVTALPLPRFVSIGSDEVFVRSGPGQRYPVEWVYKKKAVPVEIILEYDVWRKIRDFDGQVGWVNHSLLSGKRTAFISAAAQIALHKKPTPNALVLALLDPKVLVEVEECSAGWCAVDASGYRGWVEQKNLWGVYESEEFN